MSGLTRYAAEDTVGVEAADMVVVDIGEVDQDVLDLGTGGTLPDFRTGVTHRDGGDTVPIGEDTIRILIMEGIRKPGMETIP